MQRELSTLPLQPTIRQKLNASGYVTLEDVSDMKAFDLGRDLGISATEAMDLLRTVRDYGGKGCRSSGNTGACSALDLIERREQSQSCIVTFSEKFDDLLGGGVPLEKITEFCGPPGIGKTQMCLQLAVDVHIPECFGGVGGEAVYIDTEGSFVVERVAEIAMATVSHCKSITSSGIHRDVMKEFDVEKILSGIYYFRCHDHIQLIALVHTLDDFMSKHDKVKLIIVDSIAFPFRQDFEDFALRTRLLNGVVQSFNKLATNHKLAVVLTNQMTTRFDKQQRSQLVPALGESWGHACTIRVVLQWIGWQRQAVLYKSPSKRDARILYQITVAGIRDIHGLEDDAGIRHQEMMFTD